MVFGLFEFLRMCIFFGMNCTSITWLVHTSDSTGNNLCGIFLLTPIKRPNFWQVGTWWRVLHSSGINVANSGRNALKNRICFYWEFCFWEDFVFLTFRDLHFYKVCSLYKFELFGIFRVSYQQYFQRIWTGWLLLFYCNIRIRSLCPLPGVHPICELCLDLKFFVKVIVSSKSFIRVFQQPTFFKLKVFAWCV